MNFLRSICVSLSLALAACGRAPHPGQADIAVHAANEFERGPHGGRLLRDGPFALEITIFEANVQPEFRLYAYEEERPLSPRTIDATIVLSRLGGKVDEFTFAPEGDYLRGNGIVHEPHSFDVKITARHGRKSHEWSYSSYEGRTRIPAKIAADAGVRVAAAGKARIRDEVLLAGTVELNAERHAHLRARFPGTVRAVRAEIGARVRRGQTLVVVEANESMREYPVTAPFDGVVLSRDTNVGDFAGDQALIEIADLSEVWIELHALGDNAARIAVGQPLRIASATTELRADTVVQSLLPLATRGQSLVIRAKVRNSGGQWRPGMTVNAVATVAEREVPLAVRESGLQRFRDFTVVFARFGDTYEVRMLELGARDGEFAEVLAGIDPGTPYVTEQSFLIKADIEKSGASHDH
jgi:cobalt-zinc-cadmium efflux system membrane fusion protein